MEFHKSVLLAEVLEFLEVKSGSWIIDATLGDGGYSLEILKNKGRVIGIDVDPEALERAGKRFTNEGFEVGVDYKLLQGNFNLIMQTDIVDQKRAIIFDLGVSSLQLDTPERGFSFKDGPLDMRMDPTLEVNAKDLINGLTKGELNELFSKLGEEKLAQRLAEVVVSSRQVAPIETTKQLVDLVAGVYRRYRVSSGKINPATKVFQALRIAVNDELNVLREVLPPALEVVEEGGLILIISFHSLEDRIVKNKFREWEDAGLGEILTKKPIVASEKEIMENPRSRSAKLRVFRKTDSSV